MINLCLAKCCGGLQWLPYIDILWMGNFCNLTVTEEKLLFSSTPRTLQSRGFSFLFPDLLGCSHQFVNQSHRDSCPG